MYSSGGGGADSRGGDAGAAERAGDRSQKRSVQQQRPRRSQRAGSRERKSDSQGSGAGAQRHYRERVRQLRERRKREEVVGQAVCRSRARKIPVPAADERRALERGRKAAGGRIHAFQERGRQRQADRQAEDIGIQLSARRQQMDRSRAA